MRNMVVVSDHMGVSWGVLTKFGRPLGPEPVRWGVAERWKDAIPARAIMLSSRTNNTSVLPGKMCSFYPTFQGYSRSLELTRIHQLLVTSC